MIIGKFSCFKLLKLAFMGFAYLLATNVSAAQDAKEIDHGDRHAQHQHDHMQHKHDTPQEESPKRSVVSYQLPDVTLVREDGKKISFAEDMRDSKPVYLNFIYTSCTAICPVMSQLFAGLQTRLGNEASEVRMVSVSIDPEYDTPARLSKYARQYSAGPQWHFYTGTIQSSVAVQKAFDVYNLDKMNHTVVTFFRAKPDSAWVRLDGFVMPDALLREYTILNKEN